MKASDLKNIIRETLSEMDLKENITYYVCDGCPGSGDTFADDPTCGGGCSGGCECTEANTGIGMTTGGGSEVERTKRRGGEMLPTPATHKVVSNEAGGCKGCGVCHPNRCWECDGGGHKCDHANNFVETMDFVVKGVRTADAMFKPAKPIKENRINKINKNKMEKQKLQERFHQLAGIKPLYENEEVESIKEYTKEDLLNEGPELWTVLGGLMGVLGAAGITTQLQMMAEDPAIAEKYPKLEKVFTFLAKVGGALGSGIK